MTTLDLFLTGLPCLTQGRWGGDSTHTTDEAHQHSPVEHVQHAHDSGNITTHPTPAPPSNDSRRNSKKVTDLDNVVIDIRQKIAVQACQIKRLEDKLDKVETDKRRYNIIIRGIDEETYPNPRTAVDRLFQAITQLSVMVSTYGPNESQDHSKTKTYGYAAWKTYQKKSCLQSSNKTKLSDASCSLLEIPRCVKQLIYFLDVGSLYRNETKSARPHSGFGGIEADDFTSGCESHLW